MSISADNRILLVCVGLHVAEPWVRTFESLEEEKPVNERGDGQSNRKEINKTIITKNIYKKPKTKINW